VTCPICAEDNDWDDDQVNDRAALIDFVGALLADDRRLARVMAGRIFTDGDLTAVDAAIFRAPAYQREKVHG
jgi:hypothetical protein